MKIISALQKDLIPIDSKIECIEVPSADIIVFSNVLTKKGAFDKRKVKIKNGVIIGFASTINWGFYHK